MLGPVVLFLFTYIYRQSCTLSGAPRPSVITAAGVMVVTLVSVAVAQGVVYKLVEAVCVAGGVPRWEAWVVFLLLFFPINLLISSSVEAGLMGVKFGKGIEMWFIRHLFYLGILLAIAAIAVIYYLVRN